MDRRVIEGTTIRFAGVDMVDGTPLLDVKPYVARLDQPSGPVRSGWFDDVGVSGAVTPNDLRSPPAASGR